MKRLLRCSLIISVIMGGFLLTGCPGATKTTNKAPWEDYTAPEVVDYSNRTWTEAFQAAHDKFSQEYAFTTWKSIPWSGLYNTYLPRIQQAQTTGDEEAYYLALHEYVCAIPDGHVRLVAEDNPLPANIEKKLVGGGFGMAVALLDDGKAIAPTILPEGPAAKAGILAGAEILSWGGKPVKSALEQIDVAAIPFRNTSGEIGGERPMGTLESYRLEQARLLTRGAIASTVQVTYLNPGDGASQSVSLKAVDDAGETFSKLNFAPKADLSDQIDSRILPEGYGYIRLRIEMDLSNPADSTRIYNRFKEVISSLVAAKVPGIILDIRGNFGGSDELAASLSGFFYSSPSFYEMQEYYDKRNGQFIRITLSEKDGVVDNLSLTPQQPNYQGPVVALVNPTTISSGEGIAMAIARLPQGKVIGFHGTAGAFGMVGGEIKMPGGYKIRYPFGRSVNDQGIIQLDSQNGIGGVAPNPRVPMTYGNVMAFASGTDVELQYAIDYLKSH